MPREAGCRGCVSVSTEKGSRINISVVKIHTQGNFGSRKNSIL